MKSSALLWIGILTFSAFSLCHASNIDYCKGTQTTPQEDAVIQRLVPQFGNIMGCEVGDNCLQKFNEKDQSMKFSIAWKTQCGPVIHGKHQMGDNGHGSTFVCQAKGKNAICCWPLGYQHIKSFTLCSDTIMKNS